MSSPDLVEEPLSHGIGQGESCEQCRGSRISHAIVDHAEHLLHFLHRTRALIIMCAGNPQYHTANQSSDQQIQTLRHVYEDGHNLRRMLSDRYHFRDIRTLADDGKHEVPTYDNIKRAIAGFCTDVQSGDNLVFAFIGHGGQHPEKIQGDEKDHLDEYILAACGKEIIDNDLHEWLVVPLRNTPCKLTAIFDSCHSGTALDLDNPNKGMAHAEPPPTDVPHKHGRHNKSLFHFPRRSSTWPVLGSHLYHSANHHVERDSHKIFSLSACRDEQVSYEFKNGYSLSDFIVKIVEQRTKSGTHLTELTLDWLLESLNKKFSDVHDKMKKKICEQRKKSGSHEEIKYQASSQESELYSLSESDVKLDNMEPFILTRHHLNVL